MNEKDMQYLLTPLSKKHQIAFLAVCVEHLMPICEITKEAYDDFNEVVDAIEQSVELAWGYAIEGIIDSQAVTGVKSVFTSSLDEDSPSSLSDMASAANVVLNSIESSNNGIVTTLNNLESAIDACDEEPDLGIEEEKQWQEKALRHVQSLHNSPITRDMFAELNKEKMEWIERMQNA